MKSHNSPLAGLIVLLPHDEQLKRLASLRRAMNENSVDAVLVTDNANTYYLTGRVFDGYTYIPAQGEPIYFVRRPVELTGDGVVEIRKPEQIAETLGLNIPSTIGLELDVTAYSTIQRLSAIFPESKVVNASPLLRATRAIKTDCEIEKIKHSGVSQMRVYREIPKLYRPGMSDIELQIEIERVARLEGCLGQFRISGDSMELYMGNILAGDNADAPSPYDFAMGGAGLDPSLPVGANGDIIRPHTTVMVDLNGNFTGYMTDCTRTFAVGEIAALALEAHRCSIDIHRAIASAALPGTKCSELYQTALEIATAAGLKKYFMGHRQHAGFVGHGVGIEINEAPVIAPRSRDVIAVNQVIALEPKFVIPGTGAVGIENTYRATDHGLENLTVLTEDIVYFDI